MQLAQSCWAANAALLQAQGLNEQSLLHTWQAVCCNIRHCLQHGKGFKIPGLCSILPDPRAGGGTKLLLCDLLLKCIPQMQLGKGCLHHALVKQQVQGVETLNTARLAHE